MITSFWKIFYTRQAPPGKGTRSHVMCVCYWVHAELFEARYEGHSLLPQSSQDSSHYVQRGKTTGYMHQHHATEVRRTRSHHTSMWQSHLVCCLQRLPLVRGRLMRSCILSITRKRDQNTIYCCLLWAHKLTYLNFTFMLVGNFPRS